MHEVPRPKKTSTSRYDTFEATYGTPTPLDLPSLKPGAVTEIAPPGVLVKEKVQGTIPCVVCRRLRCVYVKVKLSAAREGAAPGCTLLDVLHDALDANEAGYSCGADLDLEGFSALSGLCRPYVRLKLDCGQHMELQLYSSGILSRDEMGKICGYCGEFAGVRHTAENEGETAPVLPTCQPCYEQHAKARRCSGRQVQRFDRSGNRAKEAAASQRRRAQADRLQEQVETASPAPAPASAQERGGTRTSAAADDSSEGDDAEASASAAEVRRARKRQRRSVVDDAEGDAGEDDAGEDYTGEASGGDESCSDNTSDEEVQETEPDYFVEKLHDVRVRRNKYEYLVEWQGFPEEAHFTWEPSNHLPNDKETMAKFKEQCIADGKRWPKLRR